MSLVLKSNKLATNYLGNINGIKGEQDWVAFLDFENGEYVRKVAGVKSELELSQVLVSNSTKVASSRPMTMDKYGNKSYLEQMNSLRWWGALDRFGLLVEDSQTNWFKYSNAPATQVIENIPAGSQMIISCIGTGSLLVTGTDITPTVVTEGAPFVVPGVGTVRAISVEVVGTLTHVQAIRYAGIASLATPVTTPGAGAVSSGQDKVELSPTFLAELINTSNPITIVVQTLPTAKIVDPRSTYNESRLLLETNQHNIVMGITTNQQGVSPRLVASNKADSTYVTSSSGPVVNYEDSGAILTQVLQITASGIVTCLNGKSLHKPSSSGNLNNITKLHLGAGLSSPVQQSGNCIFTKMAIYNRSFTDNELMELSKSWL